MQTGRCGRGSLKGLLHSRQPSTSMADDPVLYSSEQQATPAEEAKVTQGMLEGSNIQPIIEMTRMIEVQRAYEGTKIFIQKEDERLKNMVKEYARVG